MPVSTSAASTSDHPAAGETIHPDAGSQADAPQAAVPQADARRPGVREPRTSEPDAPEPMYSRPSKTQRKKQSHALQDLGEQLVALPEAKLMQVPLTETLREAVLMAQRTRSREGKRRQMQYIGRLMRDADGDAIAQALAVDSEQHRGRVTAMHSAERWRDGLIDSSLSLTDFVARYPAGARAPLSSMLSGARREREAKKPPAQLRALYRELHRIISEHDLDPSAGQD